MAVKIVPAVLAKTNREFKQRWRLASKLSHVVHLDLMDGIFVYQRTPNVTLPRVIPRPSIHLHAMVSSFAETHRLVNRYRPKRIYIPIEADYFASLNSRHKRTSASIGVSINPSTPINSLKTVAPKIKYLLVMGVQPGRYHAPFHPPTINRIKLIRRHWPQLYITVDGGVNSATIPKLIQAGADELVVGSAVMLKPQPEAAWRRLVTLTNG